MEAKVIQKKLSILISDKFLEFSFGQIRNSDSFHLLTLWAFAVSFPNGGNTIVLTFAIQCDSFKVSKQKVSNSLGDTVGTTVFENFVLPPFLKSRNA